MSKKVSESQVKQALETIQNFCKQRSCSKCEIECFCDWNFKQGDIHCITPIEWDCDNLTY